MLNSVATDIALDLGLVIWSHWCTASSNTISYGYHALYEADAFKQSSHIIMQSQLIQHVQVFIVLGCAIAQSL